ncbi:hypothetical protein [Burkholderia sp. Nafp2/4-1b]|nr:hypothetical protein [Burkholderia sp. Nafp2/4-1b]
MASTSASQADGTAIARLRRLGAIDPNHVGMRRSTAGNRRRCIN